MNPIWTSERSRAWYAEKPWWNGCNFLPSTAGNPVEMWQAGTFDPITIARELAWAADLGFNSVRVFLNQVVWEADPAGLRRRLTRFLEIAAAAGLGAMPVLFDDDCAFSGREPTLGAQPDPVPGAHNSRWVPSQPSTAVTDAGAWPRLEAYVADLVGAFADDPRIDLWDVYNEPGNGGLGERSLGLLERAFAWVRAAGPRQPLICGPWRWDLTALVAASLRLSDVVSFHGYEPYDATVRRLASLPSERPVLCTEWMARTTGSTFLTHLPLWRERRIGAWCWGLVAGRTQTFHPWGSPAGAPEPTLWHHDVLRADGTPWCAEEAAAIRRIGARGHIASRVAG